MRRYVLVLSLAVLMIAATATIAAAGPASPKVTGSFAIGDTFYEVSAQAATGTMGEPGYRPVKGWVTVVSPYAVTMLEVLAVDVSVSSSSERSAQVLAAPVGWVYAPPPPEAPFWSDGSFGLSFDDNGQPGTSSEPDGFGWVNNPSGGAWYSWIDSGNFTVHLR